MEDEVFDGGMAPSRKEARMEIEGGGEVAEAQTAPAETAGVLRLDVER